MVQGRRTRHGWPTPPHPEQIIRKLRHAGQLIADGATTADAAKQLEVSGPTFHRWRNPEFRSSWTDGYVELWG